ncbi:MAG: TIGR03617 family F420-dependent LLM class oxidoreductase [Acidimicrobiales bacterium]
MLIDSGIGFDPSSMGARAHELEGLGFDGAWAAEIGHDPLMILAAAAPATTRLELGTGIVVAFGRSPMITATMANDLQVLSQGRLLLGLGSQIKPHIEKRYSMEWSHPARRMREYILAMRAIWASWNDDERLFFRGEFYRHTLMTPFFSPALHHYGPPKVFLAAVGELMTEVAGEVADGLLIHPFTTERYLREVTMPALERGLAKSGRSRSDVQIAFTGMVVAADTRASPQAASAAVRKQIAFYGSTPAYRGVLDLSGWGDLQPKLNELSRVGEWDAMADLIDDDVVDAFAVVAPLDQAAARVTERLGDVIDRFGLYENELLGDAAAVEILQSFRAIR